MTNDERIDWVKASPNRRLVQTIEPAPCGLSVEIAYFEGGEKVRQDIVILAEMPALQASTGKVA